MELNAQKLNAKSAKKKQITLKQEGAISATLKTGIKKINSVILGDCLEEMMDIEPKSIDMILCDLPYGTTHLKWDNIINIQKLWEQYERIIKDNGAIVLTSQQPFTSLLIASNLKLYKYNWIWRKDGATNFLNSKFQPMKITEDICVFGKGATSYVKNGINMKYYPIKTAGKAYKCKQGYVGGAVGNMDIALDTSRNIITENKGDRMPLNIINIKRDKEKLHPTQKPVALFEYLIKTYTNEGDLVLDNCAGSGTTGIAARNLNRNYILIEKEQKYIDIINKRLNVR